MADNENQVKVRIEIDLKDNALKVARKQLEDLAKKYEDVFKARRGARAQGEKSSAGFLLGDDELQKALKNVDTAKNTYLKSIREYETRSTPLLKRSGGLVLRLWYGSDVSTPEQADKEERKVRQRVSAFQRHIQSTLALSTAVAKTLTPLPGGEVLHAGLESASSGFSAAMIDPATGKPKEGVGLLGGLAGGLKGAGVATALGLLAKGVAGAVEGGREDERLRRRLAGAAGSVQLGREALSVARRTPGFTPEEAAPFVAAAYRTGGTAESARAALHAEVTMGVGGEFTQLQGALARVGVKGGQGALDANAKKMWVDITAAGYDSSLKRINPRLVTEGLAGAMQMVGRTTLGGKMGDVGNIFRMQRFLEPGFGGRSFDMIGKADEMMKGRTSPLARAMGLMAGLGSGKSFVGATLEMEKGLFGKGPMTEDAIAALKSRVTETANRFGGLGSENAIMGVQSLLGPEATMTEAKSLIDLVKEDAGVGEFEAARKGAMSIEQQMFNTAEGGWKTIDKLLASVNTGLGQIFDALGGEKGLILLLEQTRDAVVGIHKFILSVQTKGLAGAVTGVQGAEGEGLLTSLGRQFKGQVSAFEAGSPTFEKVMGNVSEEERQNMNAAAREERARLNEMAFDRRDIGIKERVVEMKDKTFNFVIELVDLDRHQVLRTIQQKHVEESWPAQGGPFMVR